MLTSDFDFDLPNELIAQEPSEPRDGCRLLVLHRDTGAIEHRIFRDIVEYLAPGDLLVANETRVMPARLLGCKRNTGGAAEVLLLRRCEGLDPVGNVWECLVSPGRRIRPGAHVEFPAGEDPVLTAEILDFVEGSRGGRIIRFTPCKSLSLDEAIRVAGRLPLPPYITSYAGDSENYQTVYAMSEEHSAAAPTAGLHFTRSLIEQLQGNGVGWESLELEVGIDTFRLVEEDDPTKHVMHTERYHVPQRVVDAIHKTKVRGGRVIAVGTTSVRSLESAWERAEEAQGAGAKPHGLMCAQGFPYEAGDIVERINATTDLYLMPGSTFHVVDALITNFHVPRSTLMMLVSAFASTEQIRSAYAEAIRERYRFFSFGDAMLIL